MNRTTKYTRKVYVESTKDFLKSFQAINKVESYIADGEYYIDRDYWETKDLLFIVVDSYGYFDNDKKCYVTDNIIAQNAFKVHLAIIEKSIHYVDFYKFDLNRTNIHVLVLEIPKKGTAQKLLDGKYSEIWNEIELEKMYPMFEGDSLYINGLNQHNQEMKNILTKKEEYKKIFVEQLNKKYGTSILPTEFTGEFDIPLSAELNQEVLNNSDELKVRMGIIKV